MRDGNADGARQRLSPQVHQSRQLSRLTLCERPIGDSTVTGYDRSIDEQRQSLTAGVDPEQDLPHPLGRKIAFQPDLSSLRSRPRVRHSWEPQSIAHHVD